MMRRRELLTFGGAALVAWPATARAHNLRPKFGGSGLSGSAQVLLRRTE